MQHASTYGDVGEDDGLAAADGELSGTVPVVGAPGAAYHSVTCAAFFPGYANLRGTKRLAV
jgi:hypothetical protein